MTKKDLGLKKRKLVLGIEAGDKHCGRCSMLCVSRFGTTYHCRLFSEFGTGKNTFVVLPEDKKHCLLRLPECLTAEKKARGEK